MPMTSPDRVVLTDTQRVDLDRLVRAGRTEQRLALRAGIVLAADGQPNARIAASLGICEDTARKWRHRWCAAPAVSSLGDAKRRGRPAVFTAVQVAQVKALACTPPKDSGVPLSKWSHQGRSRRRHHRRLPGTAGHRGRRLYRRPLQVPYFYQLLHAVSVLGQGAAPTVRALHDQRQLTVEQADRCGIESRPVRDLLVDYLGERQVSIDTPLGLAAHLAAYSGATSKSLPG